MNALVRPFPAAPAHRQAMARDLLGFASLMGKAFLSIFLFMWIRWTIPRFRFDQLMNLGWRGLLPLALANMILTAGVVLWLNKDNAGAQPQNGLNSQPSKSEQVSLTHATHQ